MATGSQRAFALFGAILFLITSSALTVAVIFTIVSSHKNSSDGGTSTPANSSSTNSTNSKDSTVDNTSKLEGTKLANFTPVASIPKLEAIDTVAGSGDVVKAGANVTVDYTGAVASTGVIFQSSLDSGQPVTFGLNQVIAGWTQGVPGMKVGGTRRLLIPANLAYGANPPAGSGIPANADLVFDITLHKVN